MSKSELLKEYKKNVVQIKKHAKNLSLSEKEVNILFEQSFLELRKEQNGTNVPKPIKAQSLCTSIRNIFVLFTTLSFFIYILLNVHQPTSSIVLRNVQGLTYPTLKFIRFLSVPIIRLFPSLTDLYDETCLIENPYFYVADMECWPCENVFAVLNISSMEESYLKSESGTPFIVKSALNGATTKRTLFNSRHWWPPDSCTQNAFRRQMAADALTRKVWPSNQKTVTLKTLQQTYKQNRVLLDSETRRLQSTNSSITTLRDLFGSDDNIFLSNLNTHISWRITKMASARIIRQVFPKPFFLPERSGQSVERFVMLDGHTAEPYVLPNTECSYVFLIQGSGERSIVLKPSKECSNNCRTVSVVLKPSYILWYNWWYWRPISLPVTNATGPSITYINSYC